MPQTVDLGKDDGMAVVNLNGVSHTLDIYVVHEALAKIEVASGGDDEKLYADWAQYITGLGYPTPSRAYVDGFVTYFMKAKAEVKKKLSIAIGLPDSTTSTLQTGQIAN